MPDLNHVLDRFRVAQGFELHLADYPTTHLHHGGINKAAAKSVLRNAVERLRHHQERLYANATWSLLIVIQAMDAGGKDSMVKHVMTGVNPQGISVTSFKSPQSEELAHDYLWRVSKALPARGMIGVFNRSHYEEVVTTRVHPKLLERQGLPARLRLDPALWECRLKDIAWFESYLLRQGTVVLKFFLHVSKQEQKRRLLRRLDDSARQWKFDAADLDERERWDDYVDAYERAIAATATPDAPWFIVPADQKWFARLVVVTAINQALSQLDLHMPSASLTATELDAARQRLERQG